MTRKSKTYLWQFVIGLGFVSGLWTAIGIDPEEVVLNLLGKVIAAVYPDPAVQILFLILPTTLLALAVIGAYRKGRLLGLVAVIMAYGAGLSILLSPRMALVLLTAAIVTGYLATDRRLVRKFMGH
jgi:hypothetical protein